MSNSRRKFISRLGAIGLMQGLPASSLLAQDSIETRLLSTAVTEDSPEDEIRIGIIGMGIIGFRNAQTILSIPGIVIVGCCDLYQGRLDHAVEVLGKQLFTTRDYHQLLDRADIDAVIICTSDNWHHVISIDAMKKGKAVYCEKPMVHKIEQGHEVINVQKQTGAILQVGSQRVSSIAYIKAKELIQAGEIGQLNCVEATFDRQSALGAWQYTIPSDANKETVDWHRFTTDKKTPFDANRFFRWRNYREYGTGMAGDLFVHLLSGLHFITNSKGPKLVGATGDLVYWKDGRNVPDVLTAVLHYEETESHPSFQLMLRANFISGENEKMSTRYIGSEGVMEFGWYDFTIRRSKMPLAPGIGGWDSLDTYTTRMQQELLHEYNARYTEADKNGKSATTIRYAAPDGYSDSRDHFINFFESIRKGTPVVEDAAFGFRAAAASLACNESYFQKKFLHWDPEKMVLQNK